jgi:hypothetical protein
MRSASAVSWSACTRVRRFFSACASTWLLNAPRSPHAVAMSPAAIAASASCSFVFSAVEIPPGRHQVLYCAGQVADLLGATANDDVDGCDGSFPEVSRAVHVALVVPI